MVMLSNIVSITSQGQLTIPIDVRDRFGIKGASAKARLVISDGKIVVEPLKDVLELAGSLKSEIKLSDKELRNARDKFSSKWYRKGD